MLILIEWQEDGGLFRYTDGRIVFKTMETLEKNYLAFNHISPKGEEDDKVVYIWKVYWQ